MPVSLFLALIALIALGAWLFIHFFHKHIQGRDAPEQSVQVTVLDKQVIPITDAKPEEEDQEYWIYVQRGAFRAKTRISSRYSLLPRPQSRRQRDANLSRR
nr:DUF2500 family protein [Vibrio cidicii]